MRARRGATRALLLAVAIVWLPGSAGAAGGPFHNPATNRAVPPLLHGTGPCTQNGCESPCYPTLASAAKAHLVDTPDCSGLAVQAINAAHRAEHVHPIVLPSNYYRLAVTEQLFVVINLERITRGIPPLIGLAAQLNDVAGQGARSGRDPAIRVRYGTISVAAGGGATSVWSGGDANPAESVFGWMYDDGVGSGNVDCPTASSPGCWGHRDAILGAATGIACRGCVAGAGYLNSSRSRWGTSSSLLLVTPVARPTLVFAWNSDVLPSIHSPYERVAA